jgi:hypothetical protein
MSHVPVLAAVRAAESFRRLHWRRVAGVLALVALGSTLSTAGALSANLTVRAWGELLYILASVSAYMALLRLAFIDEHPDDPEFVPGPHGFQFGKPELRLLGVGALLVFALLLAACLAFFLVMVVVAGAGLGSLTADATPESVAAAVGPGGRAAVGFLLAAFVVGMLYFSVRICLAAPATVARKRITVFQTWPLTKGQFWRILAASILVGLPAIGAGVVVALLTGILGGDADTPLALPAAIAVGAIQGVVASFIVLPLNAGLGAFLYRGLRSNPDVDAFG